jgi:hypothetical protein
MKPDAANGRRTGSHAVALFTAFTASFFPLPSHFSFTVRELSIVLRLRKKNVIESYHFRRKIRLDNDLHSRWESKEPPRISGTTRMANRRITKSEQSMEFTTRFAKNTKIDFMASFASCSVVFCENFSGGGQGKSPLGRCGAV